MKTLKTIFVMACFLLALSVGQADQAVYNLQVDGLSCPFCVYGIEKQLSAIEGVDTIKVDLSRGQVFVTMQQDAILDKQQAQQAITDAGFTLRNFKRSSDDKSDVSDP